MEASSSEARSEPEYLSGVPVWEFCRARSQELTSLAQELNASLEKRRGRVSQYLPRHMRRRTASHNLRRLPVRVRQRAKSQMHPKQLEKRGKPKWSVKENRRKRRYLRNLRLKRMVLQFSAGEGGEEAQKCKWLPTHVWHAKRFHMAEQYGWRLPHTPTQKCTRHAYHSMAKKCVAVDTSYLSVFEIGYESAPLLTESLSSMLSPTLDLSPALLSLSPLTTTLYHQGAYPYGAMGPVTLLPLSPSSVWLVAHPATRAELCQLEERLTSGVRWKDLTPEVGVIHLLGPSSLHSVLSALPPDLDSSPSPADTADHWYHGFNHRSPLIPSLLQELSNSPHSHLLPDSILGYTAIDPRLSLPHKKLPLHTYPPTEGSDVTALLLQLHSELEQDPSETPEVHVTPNTPPHPAPSPPRSDSLYISNRELFSESQLSISECRRKSVDSKHADHVINTHRGQRESPEDPLQLPFPADRVPLLLLATSGRHGVVGATGAFGAGLLIFLPREWVLPSWVALTYRGVKPVGMKEVARVCLERQVPCFPRDCIDTASYVRHSFEKKRTLERQFLSRPPDKRLNFGKLGVPTPFHCPWGSLAEGEGELMETETAISQAISESDSASTSAPALARIRLPYYVVRERRAILSLQSELFRTHMPYKYIPKPYRLRYPCKRLPPLSDPLPLQRLALEFPRSLFLVSVHMLARGCVEDMAALFLPTRRDMQNITALYKGGSAEREASLFPIDNSSPVGATRLSADGQVVCGVSVQPEELKTAMSDLKRYSKEIRGISLGSHPAPPLSCCLHEPSDSSLSGLGMGRVPGGSRECCGYITSGDYSFCRGYSAGLGCVLTTSLLRLIEEQEKVRLPPLLLVRNPSALQLYPALFTLVDSP